MVADSPAQPVSVVPRALCARLATSAPRGLPHGGHAASVGQRPEPSHRYKHASTCRRVGRHHLMHVFALLAVGRAAGKARGHGTATRSRQPEGRALGFKSATRQTSSTTKPAPCSRRRCYPACCSLSQASRPPIHPASARPSGQSPAPCSRSSRATSTGHAETQQRSHQGLDTTRGACMLWPRPMVVFTHTATGPASAPWGP
jgi:hypothetical protein